MRKTVLFVVVLVVFSSIVAYGQGRSGMMQGRVGGGMIANTCPANALTIMPSSAVETSAERLGLTSDQVTSLKNALAKSEEALRPLLQKSADATKALRAALTAPEYDAANVAKLAQNAITAETAIINARINTWTQVRGILTADQVAKLTQHRNLAKPAQRPTTEQMPAPPPAPTE